METNRTRSDSAGASPIGPLPMATIIADGPYQEAAQVSQVTYLMPEYGGEIIRLNKKAMLELLDIQITQYFKTMVAKSADPSSWDDIEMSVVEAMLGDLGLLEGASSNEAMASAMTAFLAGYFLCHLEVGAEVTFAGSPQES